MELLDQLCQQAVVGFEPLKDLLSDRIYGGADGRLVALHLGRRFGRCLAGFVGYGLASGSGLSRNAGGFIDFDAELGDSSLQVITKPLPLAGTLLLFKGLLGTVRPSARFNGRPMRLFGCPFGLGGSLTASVGGSFYAPNGFIQVLLEINAGLF